MTWYAMNGCRIFLIKQNKIGGFLPWPALLAFAIAMLIVSWQSWRAATHTQRKPTKVISLILVVFTY